MTSTNPRPARVVAPGRILHRELEARGWSQKDFAEIIGRPAQLITALVKGEKRITEETAIGLGEALGTSADFWLNLESAYRLRLAEQNDGDSKSEIARKARLYEFAPVNELRKRGWIQHTKSLAALETSVCSFMGVGSVGEEPSVFASLRCSPGTSELAAQRAWVRRVEQVADKQNVGKFSRKRLDANIETLVSLAASEDDIAEVPSVLATCGVRFIVVPHLPRTKLDGVAIPPRSSGGNPIIGLTLRYDRIDYFWFTLLHELAHLVLGHSGVHLDGEGSESKVTQEEREANKTAAEWLVPSKKVNALTSGDISLSKIRAVAQDIGVHPGIVVGRLHHLELLHYSQHRSLLVKVKDRLGSWLDA